MLDYIHKLRSLIGNMKVLVPGVRTIVEADHAGRLLFEHQKTFDCWSLPHGCVDVGESAYDAAVRETYEETGIRITDAELFGIYTDPRFSVTYPNGDEVQTFTIVFRAKAWTGEPRPDNEEVTEVRFFSLDALPERIYDIHRETIEDFRKGRGPIVK